MATVTEYRISTLADFLEAIESCVNESGRGADQIYIDNGEWNCIGFALESETLTDGSVVYNARFAGPSRQQRIDAHQKAAAVWSPGSREYNAMVAAELAPAPRPELSAAQYQALANFSANEGREWKAKLRACWINGHYPAGCRSDLLQQVRNQFGPSWLARFRFKTWNHYGIE